MSEMPRIDRAPTDLDRLIEAAGRAATDGMVERLSGTAANLLEVADVLNDQEVRDGLIRALEAVGDLHRSGALDSLIQAVHLLHAVRTAATDGMVDRFFAFFEHMVNNFGTEELATLAHETRGALEDAAAVEAGDGGGLLATLRLLARPESQRALRFLLAFGGNLRQRAANKLPQG